MSSVFKAVGNAVSGVVKAVGSVVKGVVNAVAGVVSGVINFVVSPFLGLFGLGAPSVPDVSTPDSVKGVLIQKQGSDSNVPVVYGYRKIAGTVVFAETGSDTNKYLWVAYALCEGAVEGLKEVWIDNIQIPAINIPKLNNGARVTISGNSIDSTTGASSACKFNGLTQLQFYAGLHYENPASTGVGPIIKSGIFSGSPNFTSDMNFNGCATIFARYEWPTDTTNNPFGGSIPQIQVCMLGRQVASLTSGNPENYTYGNFAGGYTERYSTNPAEIVLDYLRNSFYGKGLKNDDIDWNSFKVAAAKCNTEVEYYAGVRGPILTLNYVVNTGNTLFNNTKEMLSNFRAYLPYSNGKYKLVIEDAGHATDILSGQATIAATFDKDNIIGEITYTGIERSAKYNAVKVNYPDPDNNWSVQTIYYPGDIQTRYDYYVEDGYRENVAEYTLGGVTNPYIARDFARLALMKSRFQDSINLTVTSQAFELEPGDNIYIDSNILKFGTDPLLNAIPWRIVSAKLNNDYSFTLGCVRNPDFIYPHARAGEIDYEIGLFVPKGATRYYPPEPTGIPVGVHPPTFAPRDSTATDSQVTTPSTTNPTGTSGGGVGSNSGSVNSTGTNSPATPSVAPKPADDIITITQASFTTINGLIYATLSFLQPVNPQYKSTTLYYKRNSYVETVYTQKDVFDLPGAGKQIQVQIGPLIDQQTYKVTSIVRYSTGESSTLTSDAFFMAKATGVQTNLQNGNVTSVSQGWTLPTTALTNQADATIGSLVATTNLTGSQPTSPRSLSITFTQNINLYGQNTYTNALHIYYRQSGIGAYWKEAIYKFDANYVAGVTSPTFILSDLGVPSYPNPATAQTYDFIFRFDYTDGKASKYQWRVMNARVEYNGIGYNFNSFSTPNYASDVIPVGTEPISAFVPELLSAHPEAVVDNREITIGMYSVTTLDGTGEARFFFNPPAVANQGGWYGVRVYKRQVIEGSNPSYTVVDYLPAKNSGGVWSALVTGLDYTKTYEYVVVPLVDYSGAITEATNAWYGKGLVNKLTSIPQYPSDSNWFSSMGWTQVTTTSALSMISTAFPLVDPVPAVTSFIRKQITTGSYDYMNWYYQLKVQVPSVASGFQELHIYRRSYDNAVFTGNTGSYAKYWGAGRWERMVVTTLTHTLGADNTFTINLRGPVGYNEFDPYYQIAGYANRVLLNSSFSADTKKPFAGIQPHQYFLVLKVNGTVSAYGAMLPTMPAIINSSELNSTQYGLPTRTSVSSLSTFTAGYYRNLTDYRSSLSNSYIYNSNIAQSPLPSVTPGVI